LLVDVFLFLFSSNTTLFQFISSAMADSDSDSFHSCDDDSKFGVQDDYEFSKRSPATRRKIIETAQSAKEPEPTLSSDEGSSEPQSPSEDDDEFTKLSLAERRKIIEKAQSAKEPEPSLPSEDEASEPRSPSPLEPIGTLGGLFSGFVHGGLDVLESVGKKAFETLTVKDEVGLIKLVYLFRSFPDRQ
jgi:hypothetical protein